jgi:hypothetical protein
MIIIYTKCLYLLITHFCQTTILTSVFFVHITWLARLSALKCC